MVTLDPLILSPYCLNETPHQADESPIIVSCPHTGVLIPPNFAALMNREVLDRLPDTDWYVDRLYDFAPSMGISVLSATISRYFVDLNRAPDSKPLYNDGRVETGLFPKDTFHGAPLFKEHVKPEILAPLQKKAMSDVYFNYHQKLQHLIDSKRKSFSTILLWEAHSINRNVPRIQADPFADMMIGDGENTTCDPRITDLVLTILSRYFKTVANKPFKGGYITRHYAKPQKGIMTLQLEMSQDLYLTSTSNGFPILSDQASALKEALKEAFISLKKYLLSHQ